jgi:endonuclease G
MDASGKMRVRAGCMAVVIALMFFGCSTATKRTSRTSIAPFSAYDRQESTTLEKQQWAERNCPFGMPDTDPSWPHGPTAHVYHEGYVLQSSLVNKIPLWVSERVTLEQLSGNAERKNNFKLDPELKGLPHATDGDYTGSGYDRGHQAPAGNQKHSQRLNDETFYFSNMAPQAPKFNRQVWESLESLTRDWVKQEKLQDCYIITGGFLYEPEKDDPDTADGLIDYFTIGTGQVTVPSHFYKIVVGKDTQGEWKAVGFVMENRQYDWPYVWQEYVKSVDWIEERTGLDFMPDLDPLDEQRLEKNAAQLGSLPE